MLYALAMQGTERSGGAGGGGGDWRGSQNYTATRYDERSKGARIRVRCSVADQSIFSKPRLCAVGLDWLR